MFDVIIPTKCVGGAIDVLCQSIAKVTPYDQTNLWAIGPTKPNTPVAWIKDEGSVASAINAGVAASKGEFIILIHDDAVLLDQRPSEWISILHSAVSREKVAVAGPLKHDTHVDFFCAIIPRKVWEDVGPLSLEYPFRGYDKEWCARAIAKGYSMAATSEVSHGDGIFVGSFPIYHRGGTTLNGQPSVEVKKSTDVLFTLLPQQSNGVPVTAHISTRNRLDSTLPLTVQSISLQDVVPRKLQIFDDNPGRAFYSEVVYQHLFNVLSQRGCEVEVIAGEGKGQVLNHQKALDRATTPFIWRVDDDDSSEPNVLSLLLSAISRNEKTGAVAPLVHFPWSKAALLSRVASPHISDVKSLKNIQWCSFKGLIQVDHLHNTFLYRKDAAAHGYPRNLSVVGHREETIFTHGMVLAGWDLFVSGDAITWHMREPTGGIRAFKDDSLWASDEEKFGQWAATHGIKFNNYWLIVLDSGLGDHLAFVHVWPRIKKKADSEGRIILLAVCYPEVFGGEPTISIADASQIDPDLGKHNIYNFMIQHNWTGHMVQAYEAMYGV